MTQFSEPGKGDFVEWVALNGSLLIVEPLELVSQIPTQHGISDAVRANVSVVDGNDANRTYSDVLVFPRALQGQLRNKIGELVLGRLGQGQAKGTNNPPWLLQPGTGADVTAAEKFLAARAGQRLTPADLA